MNLLPLVDSSLDFDDPIFLYPDHRDAAATARSSSGFSDFVDKTVALLSTCPIKTLSVNGHCYENSRVDDWIRVSLQRSLSELHLRCPHRIDKDRVELLFRSKTLVKLTLSDGCVIEHLPDGHMDFTDKPFINEKINEDRLYLGDIVIDDSYYFKVILICPVLEELFIRNDGVSHPPSWIGLVPSYPLKRLVIYYLVLLPEYKDVYSDIEVRIGGPQNLVFFEFSSYVHVYYDSFGDMESLVEARLNLRLLESPVGLLHRVTGRCGDVCPCYHRPIHKRVIGGRKPKLSCLPSLPLKVLEISGYGGTCREIKQMRHFLGKLQLELVKIGVQPESDYNNLRSNLMRLPRLSSKCNIQFI
ncbi:hypothetical protein Bca101_093056 [Brassica carinata]